MLQKSKIRTFQVSDDRNLIIKFFKKFTQTYFLEFRSA